MAACKPTWVDKGEARARQREENARLQVLAIHITPANPTAQIHPGCEIEGTLNPMPRAELLPTCQSKHSERHPPTALHPSLFHLVQFIEHFLGVRQGGLHEFATHVGAQAPTIRRAPHWV